MLAVLGLVVELVVLGLVVTLVAGTVVELVVLGLVVTLAPGLVVELVVPLAPPKPKVVFVLFDPGAVAESLHDGPKQRKSTGSPKRERNRIIVWVYLSRRCSGWS